MEIKRVKTFLIRPVCTISLIALFLAAFPGLPGCHQSSDDYQALVQLHQAFLAFRQPQIVDSFPDYRGGVIESLRKGLTDFHQRLSAINPNSWPVSQKVDYLLVRAGLDAFDFKLRVTRPWERDPGLYVDLISRIPFRGLPLKKEALVEFKKNLEMVPGFLNQARENLTGASGVLANIAIRHLERSDGVNQGEPRRSVPPEGVLGWYQDLIERLSKHHSELVDNAKRAQESAEDFRDWLKQNKNRMTSPVYIGLENYNWYLKRVLLMPYTVEDILRFAEQELYRTLTFLKIEQHRNRNLPQLEPATAAAEHERRVREAEDLIRSFINQHDLLTIPDYIPSQFETDAFFIERKGGKRHFWEEITYRDPLNNHIHASIPGHRFDGLLRRHDKRHIRGIYRDSGRSEGWTFYLEEMFLQAGLLDERPRTRELFYIAQLKRVLRIPTEVKMHTGEFTLEQGIKFLMNEVPLMDENLAYYDLQGYLRMPALGMSYMTGKLQLERLLSDRARQLGDQFDLGKFHDEFLAAGMIPISLIRWEMTGLDDVVKEIW